MKPPLNDFKLASYPTGQVTQWYAENPVLYGRFGLAGHNGIDFVQAHGSPMFAIEDATVVNVKNDPSGYGKHVRVISRELNGNGYNNEWTYGHCSEIHVSVGDKVKAGDLLADMGNTGFVVTGQTPYWKYNPYAGTHLHLGLRQVKRDSRGWSYEGSSIKIKTIDYDNGFKGAIDPRPELEALSEGTQDTRKGLEKQLRILLIKVIEKLTAQLKAK